MDNVTIRKANIDDLESILALFDKLSLSDLPYDKDVDVYWSHTKQGKKYFTDKILINNNICMVAEINKKTVGYFTATIKDVPRLLGTFVWWAHGSKYGISGLRQKRIKRRNRY